MDRIAKLAIAKMQERQANGLTFSDCSVEEQELFEMAELTSKGRNNLSDGDFAYIDKNGGKHLPIPDASHVRNALARFNQTHFDSDADKSAALSKIHAAAKKFGVDVSDSVKAGELRTLIDIMSFGEGGDVPTRIKLAPVGSYKTRAYGDINITKDMLSEMKQHFEEGVRAGGTKTGLPIDVEHGDSQYKGAAAGWLKKIDVADDGAYGDIEWTDLGKNLLTKGIYKFYSPEFHMKYVDPEHSFVMSNVMTGGGLVNKPMFKKDLPPLMMSEAGDEAEQNSLLTPEKKSFTLILELAENGSTKNKNAAMDLKTILAKEKSARTSEEAAFLAEHKGELTFAEAKENGFAVDAPAKEDNKPEKVTAGEGEVVVKASEIQELRKMAAQGAAANATLERASLREQVKKATFSEKGSSVAADQIDKWTDRLFKMDEEERKETLGMLEALPKKEIFAENGSTQAVSGSSAAGADLDKKARELMANNKGMTYAEAISRTTKENPSLFKEYNDNLPTVGVER